MENYSLNEDKIINAFLKSDKMASLIKALLLDVIKENEVSADIEKKNEEDKSREVFIKYLTERTLKVSNKLEIHDAFAKLFNQNPAIALSLALKEIQNDFEAKHPYKDFKNIYVISTLDGKIKQVDRSFADINNGKNFAYFRSYEEARKARNICKSYLNKMGFNAE